MVSLQGEDQRVGSCAEDLARGEVDAVVHLEVKATRQSTYTRAESTSRKQRGYSFIYSRLICGSKSLEKDTTICKIRSPLCTNTRCPVCMWFWVKFRMCLEGAFFRARWPLLGGVTMNSSPSGGVSVSSALRSFMVISVTEPTHTWGNERKDGRKGQEGH